MEVQKGPFQPVWVKTALCHQMLCDTVTWTQSGAAKSALPILCWCCLVFPPDEPKTSHLEEKLTPLTASGTNQMRKFCDDECKATYRRKE